MSIALVSLGAVPAVVAAVVAWTSWRWLPRSVSSRFPLAAGMAVGFFAGYALVPPWAELSPTRYWQWLPYLGLAASVIGPIGFTRHEWAFERYAIPLLLAIAAAWLLVPDWPTLEPVRWRHVVGLSAYLFLLAVLLPHVVDSIPNWNLVAVLAVSAITLATLILITVSVTYGQLAGIATSALIGVGIASLLTGSPNLWKSLAPVYAMLVGGAAFVGYIEPEPRIAGFLVLPVAPLGLAVAEVLPRPREGLLAKSVPFIVSAIILGIGTGMILLAG